MLTNLNFLCNIYGHLYIFPHLMKINHKKDIALIHVEKDLSFSLSLPHDREVTIMQEDEEYIMTFKFQTPHRLNHAIIIDASAVEDIQAVIFNSIRLINGDPGYPYAFIPTIIISPQQKDLKTELPPNVIIKFVKNWDNALRQAAIFSLIPTPEKNEFYHLHHYYKNGLTLGIFGTGFQDTISTKIAQIFNQSKINPDMKLEEILAHAAANNNRTKIVCKELGFLNNRGLPTSKALRLLEEEKLYYKLDTVHGKSARYLYSTSANA